jgi:diadenosine tetraphosphate (Ap4A) HIT family hydrolase
MKDKNDCPFCDRTDSIFNDELSYARWDIYPVSDGHLLISPIRHVENYFDLSEEEQKSILKLINKSKSIIENKYNPDGYNIGINVGQEAGQTVMHVHLHIIPRYKGDVVDPRGGVRGVIPSKQKY